MLRRPIIIDTDPGVDDTIAIMLAHSHPELDIKAITPVTGNVQYALTSRNALFLREYLDIDCKVANGSNTPLFIVNKDAGDIHGTGGMGGYAVPTPKKDFDGYAWDIIKEEAEKAQGELEIITLGPLTNIAVTLLRYPEVKPLIKRIVCMAGSATIGNMNPYAEFNVWIDPEAADIVFTSGIPVVMCGLDGNDYAGITIPDLHYYLERAKGTKVEDLFSHIFTHWVHRREAAHAEDKIQVMRFAGQWKDLGTWNTLTEAMEEEVVGKGIMNEECSGVHIVNEMDVPILAMGLHDVVISASPDGILVSDKEHLYLAKLDTVSEICYSPLEAYPAGYLDRIVLMGGWYYGHPAIMDILAKYDVTVPYRDIVNNEHVYIIEDDPEATLNYIREYYDANARVEKVQPESVDTGLNIYRIVS